MCSKSLQLSPNFFVFGCCLFNVEQCIIYTRHFFSNGRTIIINRIPTFCYSYLKQYTLFTEIIWYRELEH